MTDNNASTAYRCTLFHDNNYYSPFFESFAFLKLEGIRYGQYPCI